MDKFKAVNELIVKKSIEVEINKRGINISDGDLKQYKEKMISQIEGETNFK